MMGFFHTHIQSILEPYVENVLELHKMVTDLSNNVSALQEQSNSGSREQHAPAGHMEGLQRFAESTRQSLNSFINESGKIEQERAKAIQNLEETLTLIKSDMKKLRENGEDMRTKLIDCQDAEKDNRGDCAQLKSKLHGVKEDLKKTDQAQEAIIKKVESNKFLLDTEIMQNKELAQEQRSLRSKFIALDDSCKDAVNSLNERTEGNQSQLKQYRQDFEQARDTTSKSLASIKDELGLVHKETLAKMDRIDTDLRSQLRAIEAKRKALDVTVVEHLRTQYQRNQESQVVHRNLRDLAAITSKHESEFAAIQTATGADKNRLALLEEDANLSAKRHLRVEKTLGLEPMTKENAEAKKRGGAKKRASAIMLGDDQLVRKAWSAWLEAMDQAAENQISDAIPKLQEMLKMHNGLIESEKAKLHRTNDRLQSLEADHEKLQEELQTFRKSLDLERSHWQGMTRGMQAAKKTMQATRVVNAFSTQTKLATSKPLGSLVSQLPSYS